MANMVDAQEVTNDDIVGAVLHLWHEVLHDAIVHTVQILDVKGGIGKGLVK